ncbi:hypothetical protein [Prosthecobacter sp.]|uniref:hypothetical protein n=1 Tax=Prosthecobacter sp. TaxID=1965333 RepID=UPI002ABC85E7|nr:hypothetical protein [Prosthecobacter sp.]MDZ4403980.1 hypothetical protein [Prosthecobacter sp.]
MSTLMHKATALTEEAVTKNYLKWLDDDASAEGNEQQNDPHLQEDKPIEPPDDDILYFESYWLRTQ